MPAQQRVWLRDATGLRRAALDGYTYLRYNRKLDEPDLYEIHLPADHWTITSGLWYLDGELHILRRPEGRADWVEQCSCLIRYYSDRYEGANHYYYSIGRGCLSLLRGRLIVPPAGRAYDSRSGAADVVLCGYVNDHAGPGAGARALLGLYVRAPTGAGGNVSEDARYYQLLETITRLAASGAVDFAVVPVFDNAMDDWAAIQAAGLQSLARIRAGWQFRVYSPPLGVDHRKGNTAGNPPVIFSLLRGNMQDPSYTFDATEIGNHCYVLGQGTEENRTVVEVVDGSVSDSPWNDYEYMRDARNSSNPATLVVVGEAENEIQQARQEFVFQSTEVPGCMYGVHWDLGDWATAEYSGLEFDVRCIEVEVVCSGTEGNEQVRATWRADFREE